MNKEIIKTLIVDSDHYFANPENCIENYGYEVICRTSDPAAAFRIIEEKKPQLVFIDVVLKGADGMQLLKKIYSSDLKQKPVVIVTSALSSDFSIMEAARWGASYFFTKPLCLSYVDERVRSVFRYLNESNADLRSISEIKDVGFDSIRRCTTLHELEEKVTALILKLGVPANINGYKYLRTAIMMVAMDPDNIMSITKRLYPSIASKYKTTCSRVERGMRHAIEVACQRGDIDFIQKVFGYSISNYKGKPTNSEFIALIADKIRLDNTIIG